MAGIKEVAEEAGVSTATVSRALRGLHHVNDSTRAKIIAAAEKLSYPLTPIKVNSATGRTNSVGVVAPYISRWYFSQVISGAEQALREAGLDLLLYNFSQMKGRERLFQHQLLKGRVDALIVISLPPTEEEFDSMLSLGIPIALVGMDHEKCASIKIDDVAGAMAAADLVICRAGAMTVAEVAAIGVAALFVPFPHAVDDHQTHNAGFLVKENAAWLRQQHELDATWLANWLQQISRETCLEQAERARALAKPQATQEVANYIEQVAKV